MSNRASRCSRIGRFAGVEMGCEVWARCGRVGAKVEGEELESYLGTRVCRDRGMEAGSRRAALLVVIFTQN